MLTWLMVVLILVLLGVCFVLRRKLLWANSGYEKARECEREVRGQLQSVADEYVAVGKAVAETLSEIRRDIDRNYQHTHDVDLLNQLADAIGYSEGRGFIFLDGYLRDRLTEVGGGRFFANGFMRYDQALGFACEQHRRAREHFELILPIVQESCGDTDRAVWLSKTLAIFERICEHDKAKAIESLEAVISFWKYAELPDALHTAKAHQLL